LANSRPRYYDSGALAVLRVHIQCGRYLTAGDLSLSGYPGVPKEGCLLRQRHVKANPSSELEVRLQPTSKAIRRRPTGIAGIEELRF